MLTLLRLSSMSVNFNKYKYFTIFPEIQSVCQWKLYGTESRIATALHEKEKPISKVMKAYLERAQDHDEFMKSQITDYDIGRRHLANMMGEVPDNFSQQQVEEAVQYLFPSGLYDKKARPLMKPPQEVFPQRKAAEFDGTGKPYHSMFYTGLPNFFKLLYDIVEFTIELDAFEDRMIQRNTPFNTNLRLDLAGTIWIPKDSLEDVLVEKITDIEYNNFIWAMNRLEQHRYSYMKEDFILKHRKSLMNETNKYEMPTKKHDKNGNEYVTIYECLRKSARGTVTIYSPGTGKLTINGNDITFFGNIQSREQALFPLIFTNMIGKVDVEANVEGGGHSSQAGAIRWGIAMGLRNFLSPELNENMRLAGLLQRDYRRRERKKPGQEGARRKFTWKKR